MKTSDFYYDLPTELIAQDPLQDRTSSRLFVLNRGDMSFTHDSFQHVGAYLKAGDCLVLNDTRVIPARLLGVKADTGAAVEVLLLKRVSESQVARTMLRDTVRTSDACQASDTKNCCIWECLVRPGKKLRTGARIAFGVQPSDGGRPLEGREPPVEVRKSAMLTEGVSLTAEILDVLPDGNRLIRFTFDGIWEEVLDALGEMPLPPYITHKLKDRERYQTVYSRVEGSAAAPTAGLHFTKELLQQIEAQGVRIAYVTLHVGLGTFRPVKVEDVTSHHMHSEWYEVPEETAHIINETKRKGGRVICVGTTSCRTLESAAVSRPHAGEVPDAVIAPSSGNTSIFIYPGYEFKVMDGLITNFHLPESTLLMLVSAFAGKDTMLSAYAEAIRERYRFFSFGDAMLIL